LIPALEKGVSFCDSQVYDDFNLPGPQDEDTMNLKKTALAFGFAVLLATALPLRAQTGCDDSPEDPTIVLALVGGAGALIAGLRAAGGQKK
jgi:XrtJ-associated TM-motif-TM protein